MTPPGIPPCWLQIWCLKCCVAFPVACGVINCSVLVPPIGLDVSKVGGSNTLVLPIFEASIFIQLYFFRTVRFDVFLCVDTTA
jgi:hypothetical protein